jgi:hypothetical protein
MQGTCTPNKHSSTMRNSLERMMGSVNWPNFNEGPRRMLGRRPRCTEQPCCRLRAHVGNFFLPCMCHVPCELTHARTQSLSRSLTCKGTRHHADHKRRHALAGVAQDLHRNRLHDQQSASSQACQARVVQLPAQPAVQLQSTPTHCLPVSLCAFRLHPGSAPA